MDSGGGNRWKREQNDGGGCPDNRWLEVDVQESLIEEEEKKKINTQVKNNSACVCVCGWKGMGVWLRCTQVCVCVVLECRGRSVASRRVKGWRSRDYQHQTTTESDCLMTDWMLVVQSAGKRKEVTTRKRKKNSLWSCEGSQLVFCIKYCTRSNFKRKSRL